VTLGTPSVRRSETWSANGMSWAVRRPMPGTSTRRALWCAASGSRIPSIVQRTASAPCSSRAPTITVRSTLSACPPRAETACRASTFVRPGATPTLKTMLAPRFRAIGASASTFANCSADAVTSTTETPSSRHTAWSEPSGTSTHSTTTLGRQRRSAARTLEASVTSTRTAVCGPCCDGCREPTSTRSRGSPARRSAAIDPTRPDPPTTRIRRIASPACPRGDTSLMAAPFNAAAPRAAHSSRCDPVR